VFAKVIINKIVGYKCRYESVWSCGYIYIYTVLIGVCTVQ